MFTLFTDYNIDAPPSLKPTKKYSDISGLPVSYHYTLVLFLHNKKQPPSLVLSTHWIYLVYLQANYTDPQTKLRFTSSEEFSYIRLLPTDVVTGYLALRKATCIVPWQLIRTWKTSSNKNWTHVCALFGEPQEWSRPHKGRLQERINWTSLWGDMFSESCQVCDI